MKFEHKYEYPSIEIAPFLITLILLSTVTIFFNSAIGLASADVPPPVSGIEILEYENSIAQQAGTRSAYEVKVKNIGVLGLRDVRLEVEKIPAEWFSSNATLDLEFGKVGTLKYELAVPEDASGLRAFSLIAKGSYGPGVVSDIEPIVLNALALPQPTEPKITTTTTQPTTQPPIIPISKNISDLLNFLNPENVFSKVRAAVTYVKTTARGVLTDDTLIYKTAAALFVVMVVLVIVRKAMIGRVSVEE